MRRVVAHVAGLTAVWVLLWGRLSVANVVTGVLVSAVLLVVFPLEHRRRDAPIVVRPLAAVRLVGYFVGQLVMSNVAMTVQIVRPHPRLRTGVVACPLHTRSPGLITVITNILALSPGTITIDVHTPDAVTPDTGGPSTIFVHVLRLDDLTEAKAKVARLERLVIGAFGPANELAACRLPSDADAVSSRAGGAT